MAEGITRAAGPGQPGPPLGWTRPVASLGSPARGETAAHSRLAFLRLRFIQLCCYQPSRLYPRPAATRCAAKSSLRLHKIRALDSLSLRESFFSSFAKRTVQRTGDSFWLGRLDRI